MTDIINDGRPVDAGSTPTWQVEGHAAEESDLSVVRREVIGALDELSVGSRPRTVLGMLSVSPNLTLAQVAASTQRLPSDVDRSVAALLRLGILAAIDGRDGTRFCLHPAVTRRVSDA